MSMLPAIELKKKVSCGKLHHAWNNYSEAYWRDPDARYSPVLNIFVYHCTMSTKWNEWFEWNIPYCSGF